jgi:hypothetical protein
MYHTYISIPHITRLSSRAYLYHGISVRDPSFETRHRVAGHDLPLHEQGHPVGQALRLLQGVGGEEDGHAFPAQPLDERARNPWAVTTSSPEVSASRRGSGGDGRARQPRGFPGVDTAGEVE